MATGIHDFHDDPRNAGIRIRVDGRLKPRGVSVVSVSDSGFVLCDGAREGMTIVGGRPRSWTRARG